MSDVSRAREPKACRSCANAKVRCEQEDGGGICKRGWRCRRLNKSCVVQNPGAHKRQKQKSDVARLEQKLDSMTALLAASQRLSGSIDVSPGQVQAQPVLPVSPAVSSIIEEVLPIEDEAELLFDMFRRYMAPQFPFVVIPFDMTAVALRQKKPFLHLVIMMVSFQGEASRQLALGIKVKEYISNAIIMRSEKSLDLLQGLLVAVAWYHFQIKLGNQLTNIVYLMLALVTDMSLNISSRKHSVSPHLYLEAVTKMRPLQTDHTLEERRAFLGCFYITAIVSMCSKDIDPLRYTDYTKECCRVIAEAGEYPTDQYLVSLVQMHNMTDRINRMLSCDESEPLGAILSAPLGMCIQLLEKELEAIKTTILPETPENTSLLIHHHTLSIWLHEVALHPHIPPSRYGTYTTTRLHILFSCLTSTSAFFQDFLSLPDATYITMPYFFTAHFLHAFLILSKLLLFQHPAWDRQYVASVLDLPSIIETIIAKADANIQRPGIHHVPEIFRLLAPRLRVFKEFHVLWKAQSEGEGVDQGEGDALTNERLQEMIEDLALQFPGDASWQDFMFG
ncbi:hypothetical protein L207DRAFT_532050 [Hyaloscypha variabilis F]|uniref:Zn(2)-C6 fungal-type domain-containing protein n=1 Tax=Hyaloscypha variabilis (strain UAMH 11265 / GT02V1 / F) TaxID=1149755 RepID=A0A2J6RGY8_HYAVF|nr:hypothetical protein L207DRAFT_532050 [Hyaloscypha variabilis F]